ncbi:MAG: aminotransferase class I/II-fold pyridoxal phosphate-dependent enzyme, partial [Scytonema sp. PMC 1069.18]|nr:aminotransferase class I/II-fold pyridoxal phosphate-dependent enzyme [Scytonema sp. PMC 1069.18]
MQQDVTKLTDYEASSLSRIYNFTDGHARYNYPESQNRISDLLLSTDLSTLDHRQQALEHNFFKNFFSLGSQSPHFETTLFCPSASTSIEIIANYLRLQKFSVALIEPVFDNLADILKRHSIPLLPLDETSFGEMSPYDVVKNTKTNAIFLAIPNNPTGHIFTDTEFEQIVEACKVTGKILIVDFCFRFFAPTMFNWDQYEILDNSGIDYLAIEDTGKTWPTFELKVSTLTT